MMGSERHQVKDEMDLLKHQLLIIGGGAAGLMAAITAKDSGMDVAIVEGNDRIGKKILTTGNGRCNITNEYLDDDSMAVRYHSHNAGFPIAALKQFTVQNTIDFFHMLGLPLTTLEEGKMYPMSMQASSVLDIFRLALEERGIPLYLKHKVTDISRSERGFELICQTDEQESALLYSEKIILCTGGKSAPHTGSDGSGYTLAERLGHSLIAPIPALVQLKLDYRRLQALSGVKFDGAAKIFVGRTCAKTQFGEILFTDYGISGPPILQLSRTASYHLHKKDPVTIVVDMMHNRSEQELQDFLETHWGIFGHRSVADSLLGIIHKRIIPVLLKEAGIEQIHKPCWELQWKEKRNLLKLLKHWEFKVTDTNKFANSQVTAGGIDTREVDEHTLESKLIPRLYFAGEILDVDGDCGGYNLQWAWSSGYAAAKACSQR